MTSDSGEIAAMVATLVERHRDFARRVLHSAEHDSQRERGRDLLAVTEILQGLAPLAECFGEPIDTNLHAVAVSHADSAVEMELRHSALVTEPCLTFLCLFRDADWLQVLYGPKCPFAPASWEPLERRAASPWN